MIDRAANVKAFYVLSWIDTVFSKKKKKRQITECTTCNRPLLSILKSQTVV